MKREPHQSDPSWENDAVWKLLDQAPRATPGPRFVDDTVRAARLADPVNPWWKRLFSPIPLTALAGATAALAFSLLPASGPTESQGTTAVATLDTPHAAEIQEIAYTETLSAAVDHMDSFSDTELVTLIGF